MASACVNRIGMSQESFLDCSPVKYPSSYGWLSPRISFSRELPDEEAPPKATPIIKTQIPLENVDAEKLDNNKPDPEVFGNDFVDFVDFEFRLEDPVAMLPADELFSDGKLVPLHLSSIRPSIAPSHVRSPDTPNFRRRNEVSSMDPYLFSPKAPRCTSSWKELLGLKKLYQNSNATKQQDDNNKIHNGNISNRNTARSLKHFLNRSSKSSLNASIDSSLLNLPLLKDSDNESVSISSRLSLSSSSSGHEHDDIPRLSLDSDNKPNASITRPAHQTASNLSKARVVLKHRSALASENQTRKASEPTVPGRGVSADSPRMNSSGKIVFHSLERSSSSPSTFNGGPRHKHRGMERSYSANVRITPVLNVPVCSLRGSSKSGVFGLPMFSSSSSSQQKNGGNTVGGNKSQQTHNKNRTVDRISKVL